MTTATDMQLASGIRVSTSAIKTLLAAFTPELRTKLSQRPTSIPAKFPLAFPSQLHETNIQAALAVLRPTFSKYAAALRARRGNTGASPGDTVLRGVIGMYLGSTSEAWDRKNLLSAKAMLNVSEDQLAEYFDCPIMVEREHETMKGITVGERGGKLLELVQEVKAILKSVNPSGVECLGEAVEVVTKVDEGNGVRAKIDEVRQVRICELIRSFPRPSPKWPEFLRERQVGMFAHHELTVSRPASPESGGYRRLFNYSFRY